jgi:hypothetical protein
MRPVHHLAFFLVCAVLTLTLLAGVGAVAIMVFGPTPPTPFSERLFDMFTSFTAAGFFGVLGMLAAQSHFPGP